MVHAKMVAIFEMTKQPNLLKIRRARVHKEGLSRMPTAS